MGREPETSTPTSSPDQDEDQGAVKPVSFTLKETVCPRTSQQPPEQCDFKENGVSGWAGREVRVGLWAGGGLWAAGCGLTSSPPPSW